MFRLTDFSSICLAMDMKYLLYSLTTELISKDFLTVLLTISIDVISLFLFLDMFIISLVLSHVLNTFNPFS